MRRNTIAIGLCVGLGAIATLALLLSLNGGPPVTLAQGSDGYATYYVAPGGDCGGMAPCYAGVQAAVDAVDDPFDVVKVAAGTYADIHLRDGITQVVYISKTVTVAGGYTTTNWATPDPEANVTALDAQEQGRVLYIAGSITPTIEGLHIIRGNATRGLGASGGGIAVVTATVALSGNVIVSNTATFGGGILLGSASQALLHGNTIRGNHANGDGGGIWVGGSPTTTLTDNTICHNSSYMSGGGVSLRDSPGALLRGNTIFSNYAAYGGGAGLSHSDATLDGNTILSNTAAGSYGGGLCLYHSDVTLTRNQLVGNRTAAGGGGLYLTDGDAVLMGNTVLSNTALGGGGLVLLGGSFAPKLISNTIRGNTADSYGGGAYVGGTGAMLTGNIIISNSTTASGGGLVLSAPDAVLANNIIAGNTITSGDGSGLYIMSSCNLLHNTIARNRGGNGSGVYVNSDPIAVSLTDTILVSHTVGVHASSGSEVAMEATLWGYGDWANETDWSGDGTIVTGTLTLNYWDDPAFVDPDNGDYHITAASAARDAGIDSGVNDDIDGEPRPMGPGYDIGADEYPVASLDVVKRASSDTVQAGEQLTYTIRLTNTGNMDLHATVTDVLPSHVTSSSPPVWTSTIAAPGGVWEETVVVTVEAGYSGPLTNTVEVTTEEGASGSASVTCTSIGGYDIYLPLVLREYP